MSHDRPPLKVEALAATLGRRWPRIEVVAETGSTNADVAQRARLGEPAGLVLIAEGQRTGRGRLNRTWEAPARAGLTLSVLLRPSVPVARFGWLPLLTGVAVATACDRLPAVEAALKWPNDILLRPAAPGRSPEARATGTADWGKGGGILAETVFGADGLPAVVVGIGLNVSQRRPELPPAQDPRAYPPTSLAIAGATAGRDEVAIAVLERLGDWYGRWDAAGGDPVASGLLAAYRESCLTIGRDVTVTLPGDTAVAGSAVDIDADGRLVVATATTRQALAAGDVTHVR